MILSPYIIAPLEPVKMRYMKLQEASFLSPTEAKAHVITLDILEKESLFHILVSHPDWSPGGVSAHAENMCSSLLMLMTLCGLVKARDQVRWYELSLLSFPEIRLQTLHFKDEGSRLSEPVWVSINLEDSPFNLSSLTDSLEKEKEV